MYLFFFVQAGKAGNLSSAVNLRVSVAALEAFLPQYQLGGEWEGIYASHGKETVSIRCEMCVCVCVCIIYVCVCVCVYIYMCVCVIRYIM